MGKDQDRPRWEEKVQKKNYRREKDSLVLLSMTLSSRLTFPWLIFSLILWLDRNFLIFQRDFFFFFLAVVEHSSQTLPHKLRSFVFYSSRWLISVHPQLLKTSFRSHTLPTLLTKLLLASSKFPRRSRQVLTIQELRCRSRAVHLRGSRCALLSKWLRWQQGRLLDP